MNGSNVFWYIFLIVLILYVTHFMRAGGAAREFDVWFPTKYQIEIYKEHREAVRDYIDIIDAIEAAKRCDCESFIPRLEYAKSNVREALDDIEEKIKVEKGRLSKVKQFDKLLDKWGNKKVNHHED